MDHHHTGGVRRDAPRDLGGAGGERRDIGVHEDGPPAGGDDGVALMDEALAAALVICEYSQMATMAAKETVNRAFEGSLSDGLMFERRLFHGLFATADQKEGMDAFLNKRAPNFVNG